MYVWSYSRSPANVYTMYPHTHMHKHTHTRTHTTESDDAFEDAGNSSPEEDELGERWNPDCELKRERGREMAGS